MENINICLCFDNNYLEKAINLIKSILLNTKYDKKFIKFYILVSKNESILIKNKLTSIFTNIYFNIKEFIPSNRLVSLINKMDKISKVRYAHKKYKGHPYCNYLNYARYYLPEYFPKLDKIIYLDTDMLCLNRIEDLYLNIKFNQVPIETTSPKYKYFAAVPYTTWGNRYGDLRNVYPKLDKNIQEEDIIFNAGLYITLLNKWQENNITFELEKNFEENLNFKKTLLGGSQPPINMVFHNKFIIISKEWNVSKIKIKRLQKNSELLKQIKIIHVKGNGNYNNILRILQEKGCI